jgi:hypothetical protein
MVIPNVIQNEANQKESQVYEGVSKSFRTGHLERELQMVQLSATRCKVQGAVVSLFCESA